MLSEVELHPLSKGTNINMKKEYNSIDEMVEDARDLGCDTVINCTGLGASQLCRDENDMVGGRGVLLHYERNCERTKEWYMETELFHDAAILIEDGAWGSDTEPCYIIPRGDKFVVGGSYCCCLVIVFV